MADPASSSTRSEKNQIADRELVSFDRISHPVHLSRAARKFYALVLEHRPYKTGTIKTFPRSTAVSIRRPVQRIHCLPQSLFVKLAEGAGGVGFSRAREKEKTEESYQRD